MRWRPRLRTVVLLVNFLILLLPIGGIAVLRLYESELVRRTESELISQGVLVTAAFREEILRLLAAEETGGARASNPKAYGIPLATPPPPPDGTDVPLEPILSILDLTKDPVHPPAPHPELPAVPPDPSAMWAARRIGPLLADASRLTLVGIRVTDFRGTVVGSTRGELGLSLSSREEVRRALSGEYVSLLRERVFGGPDPPLESISRRGRVRVFTAIPVIHEGRVYGAVVLSRTSLDIPKALYLTRGYLLWGGAAILGVVVLVSLLTSFTVTRPVRALIRQAEQVARGEQSAATPLARPGTYEVERLSGALADMSVILETRAEYIRAFASHVSHEFKTPLSSMGATVELLKDHFDDMTLPERNRFLGMLEEDVDRLGKLVKRLLELARADVIRPRSERAETNAVVEAVAQRYRSGGLSVRMELDPEVMTIPMAPEILASVLSNFLDNARRHGGPDVQVTLMTRPARFEGCEGVELAVSDTGEGVPAADASRVFTPFFTTARATGGTGLGLSIVKALVTRHGGSVRLDPTQRGATFRLFIPL